MRSLLFTTISIIIEGLSAIWMFFGSSMVPKLLTWLFLHQLILNPRWRNKIEISSLYVNIQMTYSARKAILNNKNFHAEFSILLCTKEYFKYYANGSWMCFPRCSRLFWMTQPWNLLSWVNEGLFTTFLGFFYRT